MHDNHFPRGAGGQQFRALLGFNEPDIHHQAAMNPWHAAAIWPEVERVARNYGVQTLVSALKWPLEVTKNWNSEAPKWLG